MNKTLPYTIILLLYLSRGIPSQVKECRNW